MKATLYAVEDPALLNNGIFFNESFYGMKNSAFMFLSLRQALEPYGIELNTQDINPPEESELVISVDMSLQLQNAKWPKVRKKYLVLSEPATYYPHNWAPVHHGIFDKVFTYNHRLVDHHKYWPYNFAIDLTENQQYFPVTEAEFNQRKLCVLVAASFGVATPPKGSGSLLHERFLTLEWFAKNHPKEFDLYSRQIPDDIYSSFRGLGVLQKTLPARLVARIKAAVGEQRKALFDIVNRGPISHDGKIPALRGYRFNIAYENTGGLPGYLTEKLFDSFAACCVPIYWGNPDIAQVVPSKCFIDRRDFRSHEELYKFLKSMTYTEYAGYTNAITTFVGEASTDTFGSEANAWRISQPILKDLGLL
jgi:hypothetical protein